MIALAILLTVLQVVDGWLTYQIVKHGGSESNPLITEIIERIGMYQALLVVKAGAAGLVWLLVFLPTGNETWQWIALSVLSAAYLWVAWHNLSVYRRQQK